MSQPAPSYGEALIALGRAGWYLDQEMPYDMPEKLMSFLADGKGAAVDQFLCGHFEGRLDEIERFLEVAFPARWPIISSAMQAHRSGQFNLSVPALLAQTDGICMEVAKVHLFTSQKWKAKPQTAAYVEAMANDWVWSRMLSPLGERLPINASPSERGSNFVGLNRHMVLHGESLDYGTRTNSLKSISLINYTAWVLSESSASRNSGYRLCDSVLHTPDAP